MTMEKSFISFGNLLIRQCSADSFERCIPLQERDEANGCVPSATNILLRSELLLANIL
jgi:hypothetical protein